MNFLKTTFFSGLITIIRVLSGFVANKVVAIITGPSGIALVGSFTNFISITLAFANGAINSGIVKYSAEYLDDETKTKDLVNTALKVSLYCSFFVGLIIVLFSKSISVLLFKNSSYSSIIILFGLTIFLYSLNTLLLSILNGRGEIKKYTLINALGSIFSLLITLTLVYYFNILGALAALFLSQTAVFFITFYFSRKSAWFKFVDLKQKINFPILTRLSKYSIMAIFTALLVPINQFLVRECIILNEGISQAGVWQALIRISDAYLMLVTTSLTVYYLPKLATLKTNIEIKREIFDIYRILLPFLIITLSGIFFFRDFIIHILFSKEFFKMRDLFFLQLLGDFLKLSSWILSYILLAKSMTKFYVLSELVFNIVNILISIFLINKFGIIGAVYSYAISYTIYLLCMVIKFKSIIFAK